MGTREIFRENLKYYRKKQGLSQEQLSERIGYGITYISEIESRHKFPKPETIDSIAQCLSIEPFQLFMAQGSPQAMRLFSSELFIRQLAESIHTKLCQDLHTRIHQEIRLALEN